MGNIMGNIMVYIWLYVIYNGFPTCFFALDSPSVSSSFEGFKPPRRQRRCTPRTLLLCPCAVAGNPQSRPCLFFWFVVVNVVAVVVVVVVAVVVFIVLAFVFGNGHG